MFGAKLGEYNSSNLRVYEIIGNDIIELAKRVVFS